MSKNIIYALIIATLAIAGFYQYKNNQTNNSVQSKSIVASSSPQLESIVSQRYLPYSKEVLEDSTSVRRVLFFYASWCPTCRPADADFAKNESLLPEDVRLIRVNYNDGDTDDDEDTLADKYNVTYQHTFVQIDEEDNIVTKWNGGQTAQLLKNLK